MGSTWGASRWGTRKRGGKKGGGCSATIGDLLNQLEISLSITPLVIIPSS